MGEKRQLEAGMLKTGIGGGTVSLGGVQRRLEIELERLKGQFDALYGLKIRWIPNSSSKLDGEVKDGVITIYSLDPRVALETLRHEFVDALVCEAIKPYSDIANTQRTVLNAILKGMEEAAYREKEKVVKSLLVILDDPSAKTRNFVD